MQQKDEGFKRFVSVLRVMLFPLLILWACAMLFFFTLEIVSISEGKTPSVPHIEFHDIGPCSGFQGKRMEKFIEGDPQWVCVTIDTNGYQEPDQQLDLHIYRSDNKMQVFVDRVPYRTGYMSYAITPSLSPGKYGAYLSWARSPLVTFEFEVVER